MVGGRRIVVCMDGTWNSDPPLVGVEPTNALQIARRVAAADSRGASQLTLYEDGVGAGRTHLAGYPGLGVGRILRKAYRRLADAWRPGDDLYLFGISRGAYQALTLARWLDQAGLSEPGVSPAAVATSFALYCSHRDYELRALPNRRPVAIRFLGAFDAIEALGLPTPGFRAVSRPNVGFHGRQLPRNVAVARHALALDETRGAFDPAVWTPPAPDGAATGGQSVEQVWFLGAHGDVCGGFGKRAISDYTLQWMMAEAEKSGLAFDPGGQNQGLRPDPHAEPTRRFSWLHRLVRPVRRVPLSTWPATERFDAAAANWQPVLAQ